MLQKRRDCGSDHNDRLILPFGSVKYAWSAPFFMHSSALSQTLLSRRPSPDVSPISLSSTYTSNRSHLFAESDTNKIVSSACSTAWVPIVDTANVFGWRLTSTRAQGWRISVVQGLLSSRCGVVKSNGIGREPTRKDCDWLYTIPFPHVQAHMSLVCGGSSHVRDGTYPVEFD